MERETDRLVGLGPDSSVGCHRGSLTDRHSPRSHCGPGTLKCSQPYVSSGSAATNLGLKILGWGVYYKGLEDTRRVLEPVPPFTEGELYI